MSKCISWRKLVVRLKTFGFDGPFSGGRHLFMVKGEFKLHIPNPHQSDISSALIAEVLRQAGIKGKDWDKLV